LWSVQEKKMTNESKEECILKYDCGCIINSSLLNGLSSKYLCIVHYKQVANFNAQHKIIEAKVVECEPRWDLM